MATVASEAVRSSLRIGYDAEDLGNYSVSRLNPDASADSLVLLAVAVSEFQGADPSDLISTTVSNLSEA